MKSKPVSMETNLQTNSKEFEWEGIYTIGGEELNILRKLKHDLVRHSMGYPTLKGQNAFDWCETLEIVLTHSEIVELEEPNPGMYCVK